MNQRGDSMFKDNPEPKFLIHFYIDKESEKTWLFCGVMSLTEAQKHVEEIQANNPQIKVIYKALR